MDSTPQNNNSSEPIAPKPSLPPKTYGDYDFLKCVSDRNLFRTWQGEQKSIQRKVQIDELKEDFCNLKDSFLQDVRVKASIKHPIILTVYEAIEDVEQNVYFYVYEKCSGKSLRTFMDTNEKISPIILSRILFKIAEANLFLEKSNCATSPISLETIFIDEEGSVKIKNPAQAGQRMELESKADIKKLGQTLIGLLKHNRSGYTRTQTLLSWMSGADAEHILNWEKVYQISKRLYYELNPHIMNKRKSLMSGRMQSLLAVFILASFAVAGYFINKRFSDKKIIENSTLPPNILIPKGKYNTLNEKEKHMDAFSIMGHEVTIGQYDKFLKVLDILRENKNHVIYDHPEQDAVKGGHEPADWVNILEVAKNNGMWKNKKITLNSPVFNVDWWDAYAYSKWMDGQLPTADQWAAALTYQNQNPELLRPAAYVDALLATNDTTTSGLTNMAGSLSEWAQQPTINPKNPSDKPQWTIVGGSYLNPTQGALYREWTSNRSLKREDLGFRIIFPAPSQP